MSRQWAAFVFGFATCFKLCLQDKTNEQPLDTWDWASDDGSALNLVVAAGVGGCSLDRLDTDAAGADLLELLQSATKPVLLVGSAASAANASDWNKSTLLREFGGSMRETRWPSSTNQLGALSRSMKFREFVAGMGQEEGLLFDRGLGQGTHWSIPTAFEAAGLDDVAVSIGSSLRGLPLHNHPAAWQTVVQGKKFFLFLPPASNSTWVPTAEHLPQIFLPSTADLLRSALQPQGQWHTLATLLADNQATIDHCILEPGQSVFIPCNYYHATMNLGDTIAVGGQNRQESRQSKPECPNDLFGDAAKDVHKAKGEQHIFALELLHSACRDNQLSIACTSAYAEAVALSSGSERGAAVIDAAAKRFGRWHVRGLLAGPALSAILVYFVDQLMTPVFAGEKASKVASRLASLAATLDVGRSNARAQVAHAAMRLAGARRLQDVERALSAAERMAANMSGSVVQAAWSVLGPAPSLAESLRALNDLTQLARQQIVELRGRREVAQRGH